MPTQTTTVTGQQAIPAELMPYFTGAGGVAGLLPKAQEIFSKDYNTQYGTPLAAAGLTGAQRIAGLSPMQQQLGTEISNLATPEQFGMGTSMAQQAQGLYGNRPTIAPSALTQYQISPAAAFGQTQANQYMSPYMQSVVDVQKAEAMRDAQKGLVAQNLASAGKGTYGGARNALMQAEADRNLQTQLGGIQAKGAQDAFTNAQQQFERDRAAGLTTAQQNLQAMLGVQQLGSTQSLEAQRANQAAQMQAAQGLGALGDVLTRSGTAEQASDIDRLKTMGAYGDLQRATQQQQIDARYQDFLKQIGYPQEQLGNMADILRGVPIAKLGESTTTTTPPPSFASQLAGMGLSGLSLYNMLK
jgi:hypothetical protein